MELSFWEANSLVYQKPRLTSVHTSTAALYTYLSQQQKCFKQTYFHSF